MMRSFAGRVIRHATSALVCVLALAAVATPVMAQTTINKRVAAASDDAEEEGPTGTTPNRMWLSSSDIELVSDFQSPTAGVQKVGLRFTAMTIPVGATITNAYLNFRAIAADAPMTNSDATSLTIRGQLATNATTFTTTSGDISGRATTTASTSWVPSNWTTGSNYNSPSIASVIQEIVNQGGWASGNALAIIITGTGHRASTAWDTDAPNAAELVVTYTLPSLSGNVFEDVNYGGGAGRSKATASGVSRSGARVELYTSGGVYSTFTTTDVNGDYSFAGVASGTYYVRVVNNSVTSSRTGYTSAALAVQTYRTNATTGTAVAVTDFVGGTNPAVADPGNGSAGATFNTTTFVYSAVLSGTAQSVIPVVVGTSNITGLDAGFNFDAVVNTNNPGQGSLRQFIDNANLLGGDGSLAQAGLPSGRENAVFMLSNGTSAAGLRSTNNYFSGGIATISPTSALPIISAPLVLDAQVQPGWTSTPIVELNGTSAGAAKGVQATGGATVIRGFIINRFSQTGIELGTAGADTVQGNYVGTNAAGTAASGNGNHGIYLLNIANNLIGGTTTSARNIIAGNTSAGVYFDNADNSTIAGNYVGTDVTGTADLNGSVANTARTGILLVNGSSGNTVGGLTTSARNIVSGNNHYGIEVLGTTSQNNVVQGNYIGTTVTGLAALPNVNGGFSFWGAGTGGTGNTLGGTTTSARNVISGNTGPGVLVGNTSNASIIQGNYIGVGSDGTTAVGNTGSGISVEGASTTTSVGGTTAATMGNIIANNVGSAVVVKDASTAGAAILGNSIFANVATSIDLLNNGITANDGAKTAGQPNLLMDTPVITSASLNGTTLTVAGYVGSAPGQSTFASARVEFFKSDNDVSGFGEGQAYLSFLTTDASGNFSGSFTVSGLSVGERLTGTATDGSNNTSEFGAQLTVAGVTTLATGTEPGNASIAPGGAATMADAFTFQTTTGTDAITAVTVTLAAGTSAGLSLVEITNDAGTVVYGSVANPGSDTPAITLTTNITATTTLTQYKIRVTPKSHVNMPAPVGASYAVTALISGWTGTNGQAGSDAAGTTVTIDNLSPGNVTASTATAGGAQVALAWTNPGDADLGSIVVLRRTASAVTDTPVEGTTYTVGNTIGSSTVACVVTAPAASCTDSGLTNGTAYYYRIFARDANGNYATGVVPTGSPATPNPTISGNIFEDVNYGGGAGRSKATASGVSRSGARVELYTSGGVYSTFTTTDVNGDYSFAGVASGTYYVRVVNNSVTSSRTGYTSAALAVQTYRTNATTGTAVAVTDFVGGTNPAVADPGNGSAGATFNTTTFVYSAVLSGTAQSVIPVVVGASNITGLDAGFNFDAVVNTNNTGQGSLRQFIDNANLLGGDASLAQAGLVAARENAVFMLSNGTSAAGLRSANNYFSGGIATISPTSVLPIISAPLVLDAQKQPGWTSTPIVELNGTSVGPTQNGLRVTGGSTVIRGLIINRFTSNGIWLLTAGADTVQGNYIGVNAAGTAASGNALHGIIVDNIGASLIGGTTATTRNVVSGNTSYGIVLNNASATGNTVSGNYVGLNAAGTAAIPNSIGIDLEGGATNNTIGGTSVGARNVVSGNSQMGVLLQSVGTTGNTVAGNYVGLNAAGSAAIANGTFGVNIKNSATGNTVGGTSGSSGNVISGNTSSGVAIENAASSGNLVQGNTIGLNPAGTSAVANGNYGVYLNGAPSNTVGGTSAAARNIISGNSGGGVYIFGSGAANNAVKGNYIGLNATGTGAVPNTGAGVLVEAAPNDTIGGTAAGAGNVISGNSNHGLWLFGTTSGAQVQGNLIGTNAAGTAAIGNTVHGVTISNGASTNTIGGTTASARNVISGNVSSGVRLLTATTTGNVIQGNYIGVDIGGTLALGNGGYGVIVDAVNTSVGGTAANAGNVIANNSADGVAVVNVSTGNGILSNSIYANGGLGIDLADDAITVNNGTKNASLPNSDMDFPVFTSAVLNGTTLTVTGYVGSAPSQNTFATARVEIFKSSLDVSGNGEGQTFLNFVTTDANGNFSGSVTVAGLVLGDRITGAATDGSNNTSEFSANVTVVGTTTLGNGTDPGNVSLAPGGASTMAGAFTLQTSSGTDAITAATVTLATGTSAGLSLVEITNDAGTVVYGSVANPGSDTPAITLTTNITATTTLTQYKIRVTPKSHVTMPAPAGASYAVTARISGWTGTNAQAGSDAAGTTVTIDNLSPGNVTAATATAGLSQVSLAWTNPGDADLFSVVVLRRTVSAVTDTPVEGTTYTIGNTVGSSTVACVFTAPTANCTDTGLTNGTTYYYRIFARDANGNYSTGVVPTGSPATPVATTLGNGTDPSNASLAPGGVATMAGAFTLQTSSGTDAITAVTVTLATGTSGGLSLVEITNDAGTVVYGSIANPGSDTPAITLTTNITATTTLTQYKIRITPKTHASMPVPVGASYAVTALISAWTGTNGQSGSDAAGTTVTIDNLSPGNVTASTATAGLSQVALAWTNPGDADLGSIVVLRRTVSVVTDTPVEGTTYTVGNTIGSSTVACVVTAPTASCTDTGLTNGTAYYYRVFTRDANGNYATGVVPTGSPATPVATTLGNGTDPGNTSLAPGGAATMAGAFTLQTSSGTDAITAATVTLATGTSAGLSLVEITNDAGTVVYGSVTNPGSDTPAISLTTNITATTTLTQYKIRVTPKSHVNMPAPAGASYAVTARISAWTGTNGQAGSDAAGTTVTIDNLSPGNVTASTATAGLSQVALAWTNPGDADLGSIVVLRRTVSAVTDTPVEGTTYTVGNTIGSSTVACVVTAPTASCTDTGLTNGTAYYYKVFARDANGNYAATGTTPTGSPATPVATTLGNGTDPSNASLAPGGVATMADAFTLQTSSGTDAITAVTVTLATGTSGGLSLVEITNDAGTVVYGSVANPGSDTPAITLTTNITATTTLTQYKIRVTPKSHVNMPAPVGSSYAVTARISAWTATNGQAGSDVAGTTVTIDNLSPGNVTASTATVGLSQVALAWTNPGDADLGSIVVLRRTVSAVTDTPVEGTTYTVGNTIGSSTVACVITAPTASCTDTGLTNGTAYYYRVFTRDANGNYGTGVVPTGSPATPVATTLGDGTDPSNASLAPGGAATMAGAFTLQTSSGTDAITAATVTLATGTSGGLSLVEITNDAGTVVYGSVANPGSDTPAITLTTNITATTTLTQYKIRVTPKTHANMPAPVGSSYAVTARISAWTGTNGQLGSDAAGTTVTIDNLSPGNVTASTATAGLSQVALAWTNPGDVDLGSIVVLRRTVSAVTDTPVEGTTYTVGTTIGASTVACVITAPTASCTDTGLTNGTAYYYRVFTRDANGNYGTGVVPSGSPATPVSTTLATGTDPSNASLAPGGAATMADAFTLQTSSGTDAITAVTVTLATGTSGGLSLVEITNDAGTVVYGSVTNPGSDTPAITLTTNITATTTLTQYKIRVTPKSHVNMPAPAGASYAVTALISAWTGTNGPAGSDAAGTTVTIDNLSPGNVTASTATAGGTQVALAWTNPGDADLGSIVVLRRTVSVVTDTPVEGTTYTVGTTIGASTVACVVTAPTANCTDTGLTNGTAYYYRIFARDANGNYATGVVPTGSPTTPVAPLLTLTQAASPGGTQPPGTDITFTSTYTNTGTAPAQGLVIANPVAANTDFKLGSVTSAPGTTGLTVVIAYSNNGGTTWTYTPVSGAGGAPAGCDRLVTNIRWTFSGTLSPTAPNNTGSVAVVLRIR